jgi:hypothetical protein
MGDVTEIPNPAGNLRCLCGAYHRSHAHGDVKAAGGVHPAANPADESDHLHQVPDTGVASEDGRDELAGNVPGITADRSVAVSPPYRAVSGICVSISTPNSIIAAALSWGRAAVFMVIRFIGGFPNCASNLIRWQRIKNPPKA